MIEKIAWRALRFALDYLPFWAVVGYVLAEKGYTNWPEIEDDHFTIRRSVCEEV